MYPHQNRESLRNAVDKAAKECQLPQIDWTSGAVVQRGGIYADELEAECWLFAEGQSRVIEELRPDEIATIAWRLFRENMPERGVSRLSNEMLGSISGASALPRPRDGSQTARLHPDLKTVLATIDRTRKLLPNDGLTNSQVAALLAPDFVNQTAKTRGTSRAAACRLRQRAEKNVDRLFRIDNFLFGDCKRWIELEAKTWRADFIRDEIWPLVKPSPAAKEVRELLRSRQSELFDYGTHVLHKQIRRGTRNPEAISQAYHACVIAAYIDPVSARDAVYDLNCVVDNQDMLYRKIAERCAHLCADPESRCDYLTKLQKYIEKSLPEGRFFAKYASVYYGATTDKSSSEFLRSNVVPESAFVDPEVAVSESWNNLSEFQYRECTTLDDINFARCFLVVTSLNLLDRLRPKSLRLLKVLAQHSRKSSTPWLARLAGRALETVSDRLSSRA
ncbi:MAG: hypothetical protein U1A77_10225 [Pirellulales bacterium]